MFGYDLTAYIVSVLSVGIFSVINKLSQYTVPRDVQNSSIQTWRWKNITTSFIHSILTGIGAVACFVELPKMTEDMVDARTNTAHMLISFSTGYFIYDFLDMLLYNRSKNSYELMVHHCFVITCFGISVVTKKYVGYGMCALVIELNNIFLHLRQLLLILKFSKNHVLYRINSFVNIGTFIMFRIVTLAWMTRWLVLHRDIVPLPEYTVGAVALSVIVLMSIVLFFRLLYSDFVLKSGKISKKNVEIIQDVKIKKIS